MLQQVCTPRLLWAMHTDGNIICIGPDILSQAVCTYEHVRQESICWTFKQDSACQTARIRIKPDVEYSQKVVASGATLR